MPSKTSPLFCSIHGIALFYGAFMPFVVWWFTLCFNHTPTFLLLIFGLADLSYPCEGQHNLRQSSRQSSRSLSFTITLFRFFQHSFSFHLDLSYVFPVHTTHLLGRNRSKLRNSTIPYCWTHLFRENFQACSLLQNCVYGRSARPMFHSSQTRSDFSLGCYGCGCQKTLCCWCCVGSIEICSGRSHTQAQPRIFYQGNFVPLPWPLLSSN